MPVLSMHTYRTMVYMRRNTLFVYLMLQSDMSLSEDQVDIINEC